MNGPSAESDRKLINNSYYDDLSTSWYENDQDPIALLRAETKTKLDWLMPRMDGAVAGLRGLDVGCGGGFATNSLAKSGYHMTGLDFSASTLKMAEAQDSTKTVDYIQGDAYRLPFPDQSFNFVICFDFLEHVSAPEQVVKECARVLKSGGKFFYHTFNQNRLSWLVVIKGLEWFVKNTPKDLHVYSLFIKPKKVVKMCVRNQMTVQQETGIRPVFNRDLWRLIRTGQVPPTFQFKITTSKAISYMGMALKN